mmetsp:Transcript_40358/g.65059  ORF Transcript_40358/g.65059 Transcript_40358/m.65059 type:complete len:98 (-) Transcript_40358:234-527(-)
MAARSEEKGIVVSVSRSQIFVQDVMSLLVHKCVVVSLCALQHKPTLQHTCAQDDTVREKRHYEGLLCTARYHTSAACCSEVLRTSVLQCHLVLRCTK